MNICILWWICNLAFAADVDLQTADFVQHRDTMVRLAERNAWKGVEEHFNEILTLGMDVPAEVWRVGADSARVQGDIWTSYQRMNQVLRILPEDAVVNDELENLRNRFGRVIIRRIDRKSLLLEPDVWPFAPDERLAIDFAAKSLRETGGFDGMLPVGTYRVGPHELSVKSGLEPAIVQRYLGDWKK